jgi:tungstate transport system permease protein
MQSLGESFQLAFSLIISLDPDLLEIIALSFQVSLSAVFFAVMIGLPLGCIVAVRKFPGHGLVTILLNTLMGLPPVVVGLFVYMLISRSGPLGVLDLLYTPTAMVIAQTVLITPIIVALTRQISEDLYSEYAEQFASWGLTQRQVIATLLWDSRFALITVVLAGFGRAIAEVGAVVIVGGNINHYSRVMTTAISLETSKGNLAFALALGLILLLMALTVNTIVFSLRGTKHWFSYAQ